ncbi:MAG: hypothetical protein FJ301_13840 [Planctomycetes bacterium]|nr:hypothetical protein [Planctomycetota bacterium]
MDAPVPLARRTVLPRPPRGSASRWSCGACDGLLEAGRGGYAFLWSDGRWSDGRTGQRVHLGVPPDGELALVLAPPRSPVRVVLREPVVLAPGARLRGYVGVPLAPTLTWTDGDGVEHALHAFAAGDLASEWDERSGHVQVTTSPWFQRFPVRVGELRAIVPVRIRHAGRAPFETPFLPIGLAPADLTAARGALIARPWSFQTVGDGLAERRRQPLAWGTSV